MQRFTRGHGARRARLRPLAWAAAALTSAGAAAAFATVFATAASAAPAPAPGVSPGAVATGGAHRSVFYTASDGSVWQKHVNGGAATSAGGRLVSAPSPIFNGTRIQVFGEGTDRQLWTTSCNAGGGCGAWTSLGGVLSSKPGAVQVSTAHTFDQSVYARGGDGTLWARNNSSTGWKPWHSVGGRLLSGTGPCATARGGTQYVMVTGTDKALWLDQIGGSGFRSVGGKTNATPALTNTTADGRLVGYAQGTNGAGWFENVLNPTGWKSLGGRLASGCGGTTTSNGTPFGYALGTNGQVYENASTTPNAWTQVT